VLVRKPFNPHPYSGICSICISLASVKSPRDSKEKVTSELHEDHWIFSTLVKRKFLPRKSLHTEAFGVGRFYSPLEIKVQSFPSTKVSLWTEVICKGTEYPLTGREKLHSMIVSLRRHLMCI